MIIQVKTPDHRITVPFPTGLVLSRPCVALMLRIAQSNTEGKFPLDASSAAVYALCDELKRVRKLRGRIDLVEVETASGEQVLITL